MIRPEPFVAIVCGSVPKAAAVVPAYTPTTNARIAGEYDYTNNFADIVDYNRFASTSGSDNITHVNWTGQSSYVSGFNRSGFSDNEQLV